MIVQTHIPNRKLTPEAQARLDREHAAVTAESAAPRTYRIVNGIGVEYRVTAISAAKAAIAFRVEHKIPGVSFSKIQVLENGVWSYVI